MRSMTGFGRGEARLEGALVVVELKTVNHKGFDVRTRLPPALHPHEGAALDRIRAACPRGRVDVTAALELSHDRPRRVVFDSAAFGALERELSTLAAQHPAVLEHRMTTGELLQVPALYRVEEQALDDGKVHEAFERALSDALADLERARLAEGSRLLALLGGLLDACRVHVDVLEQRAEDAPTRLRARLEQRLQGQDTLGVDESRLAQEIAILADKADVTEELDRLRVHLDHFRELMAADGPVGRKLDFLCQELGREANTVASKCSDAPTAHIVVDLKSDIERLREQVQNVQ